MMLHSRKLHNTIQELKGNIRVFCRVRPLLPSDSDDFHGNIASEHVVCTEGGQGLQLIASESNYAGKSTTKKMDFSFDKVANVYCCLFIQQPNLDIFVRYSAQQALRTRFSRRSRS